MGKTSKLVLHTLNLLKILQLLIEINLYARHKSGLRLNSLIWLILNLSLKTSSSFLHISNIAWITDCFNCFFFEINVRNIYSNLSCPFMRPLFVYFSFFAKSFDRRAYLSVKSCHSDSKDDELVIDEFWQYYYEKASIIHTPYVFLRL